MNIEGIYQKLHIVKGSQFLAVENLPTLSLQEAALLLPQLLQEASSFRRIVIQATKSFEALLHSHGFHVQDERIMVKKELIHLPRRELSFSYRSLEDTNKEYFLRYWQECMDSSLNPASGMDAGEQLQSMERELGPSCQESCFIAHEGRDPIGIILPHLEPGRPGEGRFFYIGVLMAYQGTGRSRLLYADGLQLLRYHLQASHYIGSTSKRNIPMVKTFLANGCDIAEEYIIYKKEWIR